MCYPGRPVTPRPRLQRARCRERAAPGAMAGGRGRPRRRMPGRGGLRHPHGPASATPASTCRGTGSLGGTRFPELSCEGAQQRGRSNPVCPVEADVPSRIRGYPVVEEVLGQTLLARRPTLLHAILSSSRRSVVTARCGHQLSRAIQRLLLVVHVNTPPGCGTGPGQLEKGG